MESPTAETKVNNPVEATGPTEVGPVEQFHLLDNANIQFADRLYQALPPSVDIHDTLAFERARQDLVQLSINTAASLASEGPPTDVGQKERNPGFSRDTLRAYSKSSEALQNQRQEVAGQIREERRASQSLNQQDSTTSQRYFENALTHMKNERELKSNIEDVEAELASDELSLFKRIVAKVRPSLREEKVAKLHSLREQLEENGVLDDEYLQLQRELTEIGIRKSLLKDYKRTHKEFYEEMGKKLDVNSLEYMKQTEGQVTNIAERFNAYTVHVTNYPVDIPDVFYADPRYMRGDVSVLCEYEPTISTSTIRYGSQDGLFRDSSGNAGVILGKGIVEDADKKDLMSSPKGIKKRTTARHATTASEYVRNLEVAISRPDTDPQDYNELIVRDPQIVGFFIKMGDHPIEWSTFSSAFKVADEFQLPTFVFKDGIAYRATYDFDTGQLTMSEPVTPEEMVALEYSVPENIKEDVAVLAKSSLAPHALAA